MNYSNLYISIINNAKPRGLDKTVIDGYYEIHHIIPRSLKGSNNDDNLVILTPKEHVIAHHLLYKINPDNKSLVYAYKMMTHFKRYDIKLTTTEANIIGNKFIMHLQNKIVSEATKKLYAIHMKARWNNIETRNKLVSAFNTPTCKAKHSKLMTDWINDNPEAFKTKMELINHNPEKIRKMTEKHRGMKRSVTSKELMSKSAIGKHTGMSNGNWNGYYITPKGTFVRSEEACIANNVKPSSLFNRCKYNNNAIVIAYSLKAKDVTSDMIGKTWQSLGWGFNEVING